MSQNAYFDLLSGNHNFYKSGVSRDFQFRKEQLVRLLEMITKNEKEITGALFRDLRKSEFEAYSTEIAISIKEIKYAIKHLENWSKPQKTRTSLVHFPSRSFLIPEPLGVVLIIAPWNYPFQLIISPLVGAMAAGNSVVLKPSEEAVETSSLLSKLFEEYFSPEYIRVVEGEGKEVIPAMMDAFRFDHILYTGGPSVGKIIAGSAAEKLTPVTLELGGKSPAIVDSTADIKIAARRIAWGKYINAGQTCVSPDYILVQRDVKEKLINELKKVILDFYGRKPLNSSDYGRIINNRRFQQVCEYLKQGNVLIGGETDPKNLQISPTLIDNVSMSDTIMKEEIFGPILPILEFSDRYEIFEAIEQNSHPLALYLFTSDKTFEKEVLYKIPFGGGCVNNTLIHLSEPDLPFGGVGMSGYGSYHGKAGFDRFSHVKSIIKTGTWLDLKLKYAPFNLMKLGIVKKIFR